MKSLFYCISLVLSNWCYPQQLEWLKNFDNAAVAGNNLYDLGKTASGDVYTAGEFRGSVQIDNYTFNNSNQGSTSYLVKQKIDGSFYWGYSYPFRIISLRVNNADEALISGDGNFSGTNNHDFIAKVNQAGSLVWIKIYKYPMTFKCFDSNGDAVIAGVFFDSLQVDSFKLYANCQGCLRHYIAKVNSNGDFIWAKVITSLDSANYYSIATDAADHFYINGTNFIEKFDKYGNTVWAKNVVGGQGSDNGLGSGAIKLDQDKNIYVSYYFRDSLKIDDYTVYDEFCSNINNCGKAALIKLDSTGVVQWCKTLSVKGYNELLKFTLNPNGEAFIAGSIKDTVWVCDTLLIGSRPDIFTSQQNEKFIAKLNKNGKIVWNTRFVADDENDILDMTSGNGRVNIVGWFFGSYLLSGADSLVSDGNCKTYVAQIRDTSAVSGIPEAHPPNSSDYLFPNPTRGQFTLHWSSTQGWAKLCIYDVIGNCVLMQNIPDKKSAHIDLSGKPVGIYFIEVVTESKRSVQKIVVE